MARGKPAPLTLKRVVTVILFGKPPQIFLKRVFHLCNTHNYTYNYNMRYRFDPAKRAANLKKHDDDLADAKLVIESGRTVTIEDRRFVYDKQRLVTLGLLAGEVVFVVTVKTEDEIRVIFLRKATKYAQEIYFKNF